MKKDIKKELLVWARHQYPTQYQQKFGRIKNLIEQLPEGIKMKQGKVEIEKILIK